MEKERESYLPISSLCEELECFLHFSLEPPVSGIIFLVSLDVVLRRNLLQSRPLNSGRLIFIGVDLDLELWLAFVCHTIRVLIDGHSVICVF